MQNQLLDAVLALYLRPGESEAELLQRRLSCLPPGVLVIVSDQASYSRCRIGMQMLRQLLEGLGARILIARTSALHAHASANRFQISPRLNRIYHQSDSDGGASTNAYRIHVRQLQLAALMPGASD